MRPMLACSKIPKLEDIKYPVIASPKLDGIRCLVADRYARSRTLKDIPNKHVQESLQALDLTGLDGELMIDGDFNSVQSAIMSVNGKPDFFYAVFDDFTRQADTFEARSASARLRVEELNSNLIRYVPQMVVSNKAEMANLLDYWLNEGYEGAIVRDPKGLYKYGRSTMNQGWMLKLKVFEDAEGRVLDVNELMHNADTSSNKLENEIPGGVLGSLTVQFRGIQFNLGTGFSDAQRKEYFTTKVINRSVSFKFQGIGPNGKPRFPSFKGFRYE